jgi:hypothetical protein
MAGAQRALLQQDDMPGRLGVRCALQVQLLHRLMVQAYGQHAFGADEDEGAGLAGDLVAVDEHQRSDN